MQGVADCCASQRRWCRADEAKITSVMLLESFSFCELAIVPVITSVFQSPSMYIRLAFAVIYVKCARDSKHNFF